MAKRTVRVFLDSNVVISGILSDRGSPLIILDILCLGLPFLIGITGRYNILEIERALRRKAPKVIPIYQTYHPELNLEIIPIPAKEELKPYHGYTSEKDVPVLVSAINGNADFLVTGDKKDFAKLKHINDIPIRILSPPECIEAVGEFIEDVQKG